MDSNDQELIKRFQQNNGLAVFDQLVIKYKDMVFNLCYRFMGNYDDANDCAQDTFLKAFKGLKKFRAEANFSTWLYRIAVNTCKNKLASLTYRFSKMLIRIDQAKSEEERGTIREVRDDSMSPVSLLMKKETDRLIQKAIDSLPKDQKIVVVLRDVEDLAYEEIAAITGHNLGTVKSKLFRAREQLRNKLKGLI
ncbi:hypothetical protein A2291_01995 [candidate division WOR-1 bacterium RIFOXYB2_FULL_42_35]|uniref:RNA polymerase subunit sigma-24 n=1 Tax=candidate division WOR-1 bacterium RIFOXYC2_FULL_41_25 TaxID=1802586 RepID=A0A1F4TPT7_UNCSA|nr:MAG: hypothetical protein A2247_03795 [candidate division WOR-1 bacterium RIFOXYA2_FULL_41_14]OGC25175.1 MAG: hypothetical protein A2291_01995 [candidate division WOR-1 bacterium RIFOXYB2_FULL_42_35]OGC34731.1 MAG: hypothetical protein A2462_03310 [candidate division WOR-1 bacterium RIFOXYC2_FULL_41_25]OGC43008.1 MAG: hypothetical protein A2548_06965 [candidate division WOR-1 bacterium RIFOXYD2_FULL_41_8]